MEYESDGRKKFIIEAGFKTGGFYNGTLQQYQLELRYRVQPWGNFGINFEQNELSFPDPYGKESIFLIAPRVEINFSNNMFWTTFIQYNTQRNNININSRFQWRYKPMSDLFLVYTDNYFSEPFLKNRNRALVFKLNYWLNL
jgi:predicted porin